MRLATWNVNSVRSRIDRVEALLQRHDIDVLALQETKARDDQWPTMGLEVLGYEVATHGLNQWNGVAIVSRVGIEDVQLGFEGMPEYGDPPPPRRGRWGRPAGGSGCGRSTSPTVARWATPTSTTSCAGWRHCGSPRRPGWSTSRTCRPSSPATGTSRPQDEDVWDMAVFAKSTHVTPPERAAFQAIVDAGFADVVRPHTPGPGVYTYWDYYRQRYERNKGMRIDFVLGSPALQSRVTHAFVDREERAGKGASDHAPLVVELAD